MEPWFAALALPAAAVPSAAAHNNALEEKENTVLGSNLRELRGAGHFVFVCTATQRKIQGPSDVDAKITDHAWR